VKRRRNRKNKKCRNNLPISEGYTLEMYKKGKICLFKGYCMPILMYETETSTWTKANISTLTARDDIFKKYKRKNQNKQNKK
jgi:hypothetical protein